MPNQDTIFDKILRRDFPAAIVHEDEDVLAFKDISPQAQVHVLVIPKKRATSFADFKDRDPAETGRFFAGVSRVAAALGLEPDGYRVVLNAGQHAGQTVYYVHAHILGGEPLGSFGK